MDLTEIYVERLTNLNVVFFPLFMFPCVKLQRSRLTCLLEQLLAV